MHTDLTPSALGYHMPAEWEPHQGTWISWPHNRDTWPGKFDPVEPVMVEAVRALAPGETVHVNVLDAAHEAHVRGLLAGVEGPVVYHHIPTNDAWCRDHGAVFVVRREGHRRKLAAIDWGYNAWGGKYPPYDLDDAVPRQMAEVLGVPRYEGGMILEGGAIEVNGAGLLLTTASCLLNPNRNPGIPRAAVERKLKEMLGVTKILWLPCGDLAGDDTDGHVDNLARFVSEDTVLASWTEDPADPNHAPLAENFAYLQAATTTDERPLHVIPLPTPAPVFYGEHRLPASYANFYIGQEVILLPTYHDPRDRHAKDLLQHHFPTRRIVGIDCTDLVWGLGAFHCLTQQVPLAR